MCKATVKSSPPTNQHPILYRPDALPVARPTVSEHHTGNPGEMLTSEITANLFFEPGRKIAGNFKGQHNVGLVQTFYNAV